MTSLEITSGAFHFVKCQLLYYAQWYVAIQFLYFSCAVIVRFGFGSNSTEYIFGLSLELVSGLNTSDNLRRPGRFRVLTGCSVLLVNNTFPFTIFTIIGLGKESSLMSGSTATVEE